MKKLDTGAATIAYREKRRRVYGVFRALFEIMHLEIIPIAETEVFLDQYIEVTPSTIDRIDMLALFFGTVGPTLYSSEHL